MSGLSKVIVLDPDVRASRQIQLGFEREGLPATVVQVPVDASKLDLFGGNGHDTSLVVVGGAELGALELIRRARSQLDAGHLEVPIVFAGRGVRRTEAEAAGADEVVLQPAHLRDVVTVGRLLRGTPAHQRRHLVGNLAETTGVFTLVRALSALGRSAVLTLIRGLRRGEVRFYHGEVTSAQVGLIHGQAALHQLLLWTDARFDFRHEDIVRRQQIPLPHDELFADAERFLATVRSSAGALSPSMVLEQDVAQIHQLGKQIPTEVHGVLRMFDGHRVIADVLEDSPYRVFETLRVTQRALDAGLLRLAQTPRPKATWRAVLAIEEWLVGGPAEKKERAPSESGPISTGESAPYMKGRRKRKKRRQNTPIKVPIQNKPDIDWGALVPRVVGAEVGPLAGVVPAAHASGEIVLPSLREEPREKLESLMDTGAREKIFPRDAGVEPKVVWDEHEVDRVRADAEAGVAPDAPTVARTPSGEIRNEAKAEVRELVQRMKRETADQTGADELAARLATGRESGEAAQLERARLEADAKAKAEMDARAEAEARAKTEEQRRLEAKAELERVAREAEAKAESERLAAAVREAEAKAEAARAAAAQREAEARAAQEQAERLAAEARAEAERALAAQRDADERREAEAKAAAWREAEAKVAAEREAQRLADEQREAAAQREAEVKAAAEREAAAQREAEVKAAAEREAAAQREAERDAAAEREAEVRAAAERDAAAQREAEVRAAAERDAAAQREAEVKAAAEREAAAQREAEVKAAAEREAAVRAAAEREAAAKAERERLEAEAAAQREAEARRLADAQREAEVRADAERALSAQREAQARLDADAQREEAARDAARREADAKQRAEEDARQAAAAEAKLRADATARADADAAARAARLAAEAKAAADRAEAEVRASHERARVAEQQRGGDSKRNRAAKREAKRRDAIEAAAIAKARADAEARVLAAAVSDEDRTQPRPRVDTSATALVRELVGELASSKTSTTESVVVAETATATVLVADVVDVSSTETTARLTATPVATVTEPDPAVARLVAQPSAVVAGVVEAAPHETVDEPSDGVIRELLDSERQRRPVTPPPTIVVEDDRPEDRTGEITAPVTQAPVVAEPEPSILVSDLEAVHSTISAIATAQVHAPPTPNAATPSKEHDVAAVRDDAQAAFSDVEEAFFRGGEDARPAIKQESFDDLDEGYQPVGFWDRLLGRKQKPKR